MKSGEAVAHCRDRALVIFGLEPVRAGNLVGPVEAEAARTIYDGFRTMVTWPFRPALTAQ